MLAAALALAAPDWTDCPAPCRCKWSSGKKTALCKDATFTAIPDTLDAEMQVLDLSGNTITRLVKDTFKTAGLINLQRIFLRSAKIREVHRDAFYELTILIEVDLSDNELTNLHPDTFHGNGRLRVLYLSGNPLRRLAQAQFPTLPHLRTLELEGCQLESVHRDAFVNLNALESLNLKSNHLHNLSERVLMDLHLKSLSLDGNPWRCDCDLRVFRNWFLTSNLHSVSLVCVEPEVLKDRLWEDVPTDEFACPPEVSLTTQTQVQAEAGGNVSFGCHVVGDPEPKVSWLFEGAPINHTWVTLEAEEGLLNKWVNISVSNVSDADAGVYSCVAKNSLALVSRNVTLVLPEVVTATTLSKSDSSLVYWVALCVGATVAISVICTTVAVCCVRSRNSGRNMKASVSFTDQEKKLLDVSIATTTDRGTGSSEALGPELELMEPPVHITIESEPLPLAVYPPPPEFSTNTLPAGAYGNIFISVSVSRDPTIDASRCPDLLDLPHRVNKPMYHGMATLPRRPCAAPQYDNMGPRVTACGSSTLSLPDSMAEVPPPPPPPSCVPLTPEFVSL